MTHRLRLGALKKRNAPYRNIKGGSPWLVREGATSDRRGLDLRFRLGLGNKLDRSLNSSPPSSARTFISLWPFSNGRMTLGLSTALRHDFAVHLAGGTQLAFHTGAQRGRGKPVPFVELCFQPIDPLQKILGIFG